MAAKRKNKQALPALPIPEGCPFKDEAEYMQWLRANVDALPIMIQNAERIFAEKSPGWTPDHRKLARATMRDFTRQLATIIIDEKVNGSTLLLREHADDGFTRPDSLELIRTSLATLRGITPFLRYLPKPARENARIVITINRNILRAGQRAIQSGRPYNPKTDIVANRSMPRHKHSRLRRRERES